MTLGGPGAHPDSANGFTYFPVGRRARVWILSSLKTSPCVQLILAPCRSRSQYGHLPSLVLCFLSCSCLVDPLLPCRRITNRESAQRMRRKRQEDFQAVVDRLATSQAENIKLKQVRPRHTSCGLLYNQ